MSRPKRHGREHRTPHEGLVATTEPMVGEFLGELAGLYLLGKLDALATLPAQVGGTIVCELLQRRTRKRVALQTLGGTAAQITQTKATDL